VAWLVGIVAAGLIACAAASATFNGCFEKTEVSGLPWQEVSSP
jgi:hypothetical protein